MWYFILGLILGWIFSRSYKKLKVDMQEILDDLKSLTSRASQKLRDIDE
jgi:uncharacterized membrane protein YciS (DUF1049 family)